MARDEGAAGGRLVSDLRATETSPVKMGKAILSSTIKTMRPAAKTPAEIFHSVMLGVYSTISCRVLGTKPGMMRPIPFSIQTPPNAQPQALNRTRFFVRLAGK